MSADGIDYPKIIQDALRDVVRRVLVQVAEEGLPGEHHFYISFRTDHPEVVLPNLLRDQYPEEMTIVLQNQYWELEVGPDSFSVLLNFNARRQGVTVPFAAITGFVDPAAELALRFDGGQAPAPKPEPEAEEAPKPPAKSGNVIGFDPSRRR